jgi:hypothetical protein
MQMTYHPDYSVALAEFLCSLGLLPGSLIVLEYFFRDFIVHLPCVVSVGYCVTSYIPRGMLTV